MHAFYGRHERHALLRIRYPDASVLQDVCSFDVVNRYRTTFRDQILRDTAFQCMQNSFDKQRQEGSWERTDTVARGGVIVTPLASAESCLVAAYAMLKCKEIFETQCWYPLVLYHWGPTTTLPVRCTHTLRFMIPNTNRTCIFSYEDPDMNSRFVFISGPLLPHIFWPPPPYSSDLHTYIYRYLYIYIYIYVHICVYISSYMYMYIFVYIY